MQKSMFTVQFDGTIERVLASNIFEAISNAKKFGNNKYKKCEEVNYGHEVFYKGKLKPINQIYRVEIDHETLLNEDFIYYVIARGVTYAANYAMEMYFKESKLNAKEKRGVYIRSVKSDHVIYTF